VELRNAATFLAWAIALLLLFGAGRASAQECPRADPTGAPAPSQVQSLDGVLVYHDGIRQWFELKLGRPKCGQASVQIVDTYDAVPALATLRGCRVKSQGPLDFAGTGYLSKDVFQAVRKVEPLGACVRQPAFPSFAGARPDRRIRSYVVTMDIDYRPGDRPILFHVRGAGRDLQPWQAYASYALTGGFALYGFCADGFVTDRVFGTPAAHPGHAGDPREPGDMASYDPESAAQAGKTQLRLGYSCVRLPRAKR
jgi:hypothetical protein